MQAGSPVAVVLPLDRGPSIPWSIPGTRRSGLEPCLTTWKGERGVSLGESGKGKTMSLKSLFGRKQNRFYLLLTQQTEMTLKGMEALLEYVTEPTEDKARGVSLLESEADEVRRILIDELNRTFITPFDREDIFALSRTIDDVLDYGETTVEEMTTLGVEPNGYIRDMATILRDAARELHLAMLRLKDHPQVALDHATRAKALENQAERIYRQAIANLFTGPQDIEHVVIMLKMREVYRHLSNAADRGDEAANILSDIVVKTT